jgi:phage gpG-like protein
VDDIRVDFDSSELLGLLGDLRRRTGDLSDTMAIVAEQLVAAVNDEFETAGQGKWPPLAESTLAKRRGSTAQILVDTGRLAGSISADSGPDFAEAGTNVEYAVYHVSSAPRRVIPLRDFFDLPDEVFAEAESTIVAGILRGFT